MADQPTPALFSLFFWQQQVNTLVKTVTAPLSSFLFFLHPTITIAPATRPGVQELKFQHRLFLAHSLKPLKSAVKSISPSRLDEPFSPFPPPRPGSC